MSRLLHVRQFISDTVSAADLWLIFGGVALALLLAGWPRTPRAITAEIFPGWKINQSKTGNGGQP
jgi:hypothetical protein